MFSRRHRRTYFRIQATAYQLGLRLEREREPLRRSMLLTSMAECEAQLSDLHGRTFGADPLPDEPGRDLAESLRSSSRVLLDLAEVDRTVAMQEAGYGALVHRRPVPGSEIEETCGPVLDVMVEEGGTFESGQFDELWRLAVKVVGGQAAECIPWVRECRTLAVL